MAMTVEQFVSRIAQSGLFAAAQLQTLRTRADDFPSNEDAENFGRELVQQGTLTAYQATTIWQDKQASLVFGNYAILDKLGEGGMGMVFKAEHRRMERIVALKVLSPKVTQDPTSLQRFHREVKAAAKLTHPNIVAAYDADEAKHVHFLVMEYVDGMDLSKLVRSKGPLPVDQAVFAIVQAAAGLEHAHQKGVIHRDIKPSNLLMDRSGTVKILDMGLARIDAFGDNIKQSPTGEQSELTTTGTLMGTIDYMSPEQALDTKQADRRADVYSLGCSLYFVLTGKSVYGGDSIMKRLLAHRETPIPSVAAERSEVPARLDAVLQRMIAKHPDERYQTMAEVISALKSKSGATPGTSAAPAAPSLIAAPGEDSAFQAFLNELPSVATKPDMRQQSIAATADGSDTLVVNGQSDTQTGSTISLGSVRQTHSKRFRIAAAAAVAGVLLIAFVIVMLPHDTDDDSPNAEKGRANSGSAKKQAAAGDDGTAATTGTSASVLKIADWVLSIPNSKLAVVVKGSDRPVSVESVDKLPTERFKITKIDIDCSRVSDPVDFKRLNRLLSLESLWLRDVNDAVVKQVYGLKLIDLSLLGGTIDDNALATLNRNNDFSGLQFLTLKSLKMSGDVFHQLWPHAALTLSIQGTCTDEMLQRLHNWPVRDLSLADASAVTDDGLLHLANVVGLNRVNVARTGVTAAGVASLEMMLPKCTIECDFNFDDIAAHRPKPTVQVIATLKQTLTAHQAAVKRVAFSPDSSLLSTRDADGVIHLWTPGETKPRQTIRGPGFGHGEMSFTPDNKWLCSVHSSFHLWNLADGSEAEWAKSFGQIRTALLAPDGKHVAVSGQNDHFYIFNVANPLEKLQRSHRRVQAFAFSPDSSRLATISGEVGILKIWTLAGDLVAERNAHRLSSYDVDASTDGRLLATGSGDNTAKIWSFESGKLLRVIRGEHVIFGVSFTPDARVLATADGYVKTASLWDTTTGVKLETLTGHTAIVSDVQVSPDGKWLATACDDTTVRLWQVEVKPLAEPRP